MYLVMFVIAIYINTTPYVINLVCTSTRVVLMICKVKTAQFKINTAYFTFIYD